jgi:hypothetical protein
VDKQNHRIKLRFRAAIGGTRSFQVENRSKNRLPAEVPAPHLTKRAPFCRASLSAKVLTQRGGV